MNYQQELTQNRLANNLELSPVKAEWRLYKESHYKYDECYDYATELIPWMISEFEREQPRFKQDAELAVRNQINEPRENAHYFIYMLWLGYKYKHFVKNWKPKSNDGLNFMHVTFNFSDKISVNDMLLEITRIVNLSIFDKCKMTWTYEYYTEKGAHPHVHMLIELNRTGTINPSVMEQKVFQKKSLREVMNYKYKLSWARDYKDRCDNRAVIIAYITGNKIESKSENVEKDKLWRKINNLDEIYIKENN